ncbi:HIT domain-containing protein [Vulcanisaeta thermophila]|uniref:HIT domain-containing protein n=1 Tax=Vulcanisaeta thermophila TaxID=867917 RepID=UPI000853588F|nr:HIT domain-containing protein [Vulcanisaeta thermophila]
MASDECWVCRGLRSEDLVLMREGDIVVFLNPEPFNNGHLVIAPTRHAPIDEVDESLLLRMLLLAKRFVEVLQRVYAPHGFNIDIAPSPHVHIQVVPRWEGDVSFVTLFHGLKTVPESLRDSLRRLREVMGYGT